MAQNKTNGNAKSFLWLLVINADKKTLDSGSNASIEQFFKRCESQLLSYNAFKFIATMLHDKDITENKEHKTIHLHAFIELSNTIEPPTKHALLKDISALLNVSENLLSLDKTENNFLGIQYLTHKNDTTKFQYDYKDIKTNNESILKERYFMEYRNPNDILTDILACSTLTELMQRQGLLIANKYRNTFNQVKQEQKQDYESLLQRYKVLWKDLNRLVDSVNLVLSKLDRLPNEWRATLDEHNIIDNLESLITDIYNNRYN